MTRHKFTQKPKFRDRSNTTKTNGNSTTAPFFTPRTDQHHPFRTVFLKTCFFEINVFANSVPFPAAPNCPRDQISRRRSTPIKTKLKSTTVTFWTPPQSQTSQYSLGRVAIFASPVRTSFFMDPPEASRSGSVSFCTRLIVFLSEIHKMTYQNVSKHVKFLILVRKIKQI